MGRGTWKKVLGLLTQLPNIFGSGSAQAGTKPAEWYLDLTAECLEQAQQMIAGSGSPTVELKHNQRRRSTKLPRLAENESTGVKLYKCQCEYLVEKLATAAFSSRETYLNTVASSAQQLTYHKLLKLLSRLATNVHGFVDSCCKEGGMQVALTAASVLMYVCSLGFYLEVCTKLLHSNSLGVATPTEIELERLRLAEKNEVERLALFDEATLMHTINSLILNGESSSASVQLQLATIVQKRLKASQGTSTSGASKVSYLEAWQVDGKSLLRLAELGTGSSAAVHKAKWFGAIEVAEKVFRVSRDDSFDREMSLLAELSHPNIVSTLGYWADEHSCSIVTELMDGDLYRLMGILPPQGGMGPFSISVACDIMLQVAQGMAYIHDKGVVHRDLKSHNILFRRSKDDDIEYICVKVGDFGISKTKERSFLCTHQTSNTGSDRSIAPELIELPGEKKKAQSSFHPYKSDVYSFGMLCFEILTGELPFSTIKKPREVKKKVLAGIRPVLPPQCPQELKRLIVSCWDSDPTKRPDFPRISEALMGLYFSLLIGHPDFPEQKVRTVGFHANLSTNRPQWYLDRARECMEHVQLMTASEKSVATKVRIHYSQCQYLADTLKMVVEIGSPILGPLYARTQTWTHTKLAMKSSSELKTKSTYQLGILMLLWQSATDIEPFIKDCCSINWLKISVTSGSVAQSPLVSVSSWGYHLKLCQFVLLHNDTLGATSLTMNDIESMKEVELLAVKEKASVDDATLLSTLSLILSSGSTKTDEFQLATILQKRLEVKQAMLTIRDRLEPSHERFNLDSRALAKREILGRGSNTSVYKCTWYGAKVAIKTIPFDVRDALKEISISSGLSHPNIVHMLGYSYTESECIIVMELVDMNLSSLIQERLQNLPNDSTPFNIHEVVDLMLQVADGMNYLHQLKVVHRDLKSSNILVGRVRVTNLNESVPELFYAKVADFGLSKIKERSMTYSHQSMNVGTTRWMAPEVMEKEGDEWVQHRSAKYPFKSDIFSFGNLCCEILTGNIPFSTLDESTMKKAILNGDRPSLPLHCPQELKTLIEACWHPNPTSRPSSTQICQELRYLKYTSLLWTGDKGESQAQQWFQEVQPDLMTRHIAKKLDFSRLSVTKIENACLHPGIQLGKGAQETYVYRTIHRQSKAIENCVAQKRFVPTYNEDFQNEIMILSYLKHPNIVSLVGYAVDNRSCSIIMELMDGDLHDLICRKMHRVTLRGPFTNDEGIHVMLQIAEGMDYVHQKNVVHRDLKSYNILVQETNVKGKHLDIKVADFGLSKQLKPGSDLHFNVGTVGWMAPEVMRLKAMRRRTSKFFYFSNALRNIPLMSQKCVKKMHDPFKSDIYSFGIVCFEILTGNVPTFHLKNGSGNAFQRYPQNPAMLLHFLFLEGLIKLKEDPQKASVIVLLLLKGLNFMRDPYRAIIILMVLHLKLKMKRDQNEELKEKVMAGHRPILPDYCPPELKALIESCWDKDASKRPTFAQIIMVLKGLLL